MCANIYQIAFDDLIPEPPRKKTLVPHCNCAENIMKHTGHKVNVKESCASRFYPCPINRYKDKCDFCGYYFKMIDIKTGLG